MDLQGDHLIDGRFRLIRKLGGGGMGEVWAARDSSNDRDVAVKVMRATGAPDPTRVERVRREAQLIDGIRSPFVCPLLDSGTTEEGRPYLVLPLLEGSSLASRIAQGGRLPLREAVWVLDHILQGLRDVHALGVIHRDIKPANVFLCDEPGGQRAVLLDFGIAKLLQGGAPLTAFGATLGSVAYMAPEQAGRAALVDERADLYAVGTTLFHALAGRLPFVAPKARALLALKQRSQPPSLEEVTGVPWPVEVESYLSRLLARDPGARFPSAQAALEAWRGVCADGVVEVDTALGYPAGDEAGMGSDTWMDASDTLTDVTGPELDGELEEDPTDA